MSIFSVREMLKLQLLNFAMDVNREVCVRTGTFKPDPKSPEEMRQAREGLCGIKDLDAVEHYSTKLPV